MNCKQGDLAIVIGGDGDRKNVGKIVRCVKLSSFDQYEECWEVDILLDWQLTMLPFAPDCFLRPLPELKEPEEILEVIYANA